METIRFISGYFVLLSFVTLVFTGFRSDFNKKAYRQNPLSIEISFDSIKPGQISLDQINSLKNLVIKSDGKTYNAKSYEIGIMPNSSPSHFIKWYGNNLPDNALYWMKKTQPGDMIIVAKLVIYGIDKYEVVSDPEWTVSKDQ